jgi:hypothetical protein
MLKNLALIVEILRAVLIVRMAWSERPCSPMCSKLRSRPRKMSSTEAEAGWQCLRGSEGCAWLTEQCRCRGILLEGMTY